MFLYMFSDFIISVFLLISYIFLIVLYLCFKQVEKNYLKIDLKTYINYYILMNYQYIMLIVCLFFVYVIINRLGLLGEVVISGCIDNDNVFILIHNEILENKNILRNLNSLTTQEKFFALENLINKLCVGLQKLDFTYFDCDKSEYEYFAKSSMILSRLKKERELLSLSCFQYSVLNKLCDNLCSISLTDKEAISFFMLKNKALNINYNNLCNYICAYNDFVRKLEVFNSNVPKVLDEYFGEWSILPKIFVLNEELNKILIKNNLESLVFSNTKDITNIKDRDVFNLVNKFSDILKLNILNSDDIRVLQKVLLNFEMDCHNMYREFVINNPEKCINTTLVSKFSGILETKVHIVREKYDNALNVANNKTSSSSNNIVEESIVNNVSNNPKIEENSVSNASKNVANDVSLLSRIINNHILGPYSITWSCAIWTVVGLVILNSYL